MSPERHLLHGRGQTGLTNVKGPRRPVGVPSSPSEQKDPVVTEHPLPAASFWAVVASTSCDAPEMEGWRPVHCRLLKLFLFFSVLFCACVTAVQLSLPTPGFYWVHWNTQILGGKHDLSLSEFKMAFLLRLKGQIRLWAFLLVYFAVCQKDDVHYRLIDYSALIRIDG